MATLLRRGERAILLAALAVLRLRARRLREIAEQGSPLTHLHVIATALETEVLVERLARHIQAHSDKASPTAREAAGTASSGSPTHE